MTSYFSRLIILIISILSNTAQSMPNNNVDHQMHDLQQRVPTRINFTRALQVARNFSCQTPQLRSYNLRDSMRTVHKSSEIVNFPLYIVLNRCDVHSGCCRDTSKSCTPIESLIYHDEIEIELSSLETNRTKKLWIKVEQHGNCTCSKTNPEQRRNYSNPNIKMIDVP
ncbi:hypothetical protein M0802_012053 [Mischocyttarus mexicanus]|nr:hypothetical protein M0802_012053 [Mischocyttarus mexicanus]